jgi:hypothetical protein
MVSTLLTEECHQLAATFLYANGVLIGTIIEAAWIETSGFAIPFSCSALSFADKTPISRLQRDCRHHQDQEKHEP